MKADRVIFLDFDGVLVNRKSWYVRSAGMASADPPCVAALNEIVLVTGAAIVVSSSWRRGAFPGYVASVLKKWGVVAKIIDQTPTLDVRRHGMYVSVSRTEEIAAWLKRNPTKEFVILDDDKIDGKLAARHVQTEFEIGLTAAHAARAIALFEGNHDHKTRCGHP